MNFPRFIVSTGRCGSTLLSRTLGAHPEVLNVSEVFSALQPGALPAGEMSGAAFWAMLSRPNPAWSVVLAHRLEPAEFLYPIDRGGRFDRRSGVPPIAGICLPAISNEPDALYGELETVTPSFTGATVGRLYQSLFIWLAARFGKAAWFERSGGSLRYCAQIAAHFPDARLIHLYRNGYDTAISMSRHVFFRMAVVREMLTAALGYDPYERGESRAASSSVPAHLARLLPERFDPHAFSALRVPVERFGRRWSAEILYGTAQLAKLPASRVHHVSLSELVSAPEQTVRRLFDFFAVPDPPDSYITRILRSVASTRRADAPCTLSVDESARLWRACEPGEARLRALTGSA